VSVGPYGPPQDQITSVGLGSFTKALFSYAKSIWIVFKLIL
jgi:hypothetical protein